MALTRDEILEIRELFINLVSETRLELCDSDDCTEPECQIYRRLNKELKENNPDA